MTYGMINCFACGDYVYDRDIEKLAKNLNSRSSTQGMNIISSKKHGKTVCVEKHFKFYEFTYKRHMKLTR